MLQLPTITVRDETSGAVVGDQIRFANTGLARLIGLLGAANLKAGEGLLLAPSSGIHTWGMSFAIDVVALDRYWRVRRIWHAVPPWHICASPVARIILELPAGRAEELGLRMGHHLAFTLHS